jgi:Carboxypeptidase regulatory-like domain
MKRPFLAALSLAAAIFLVAVLFFVAMDAAAAQAGAGNRVISGVVTGTGGQPLADANVALSETVHPGPFTQTTTDTQGRFKFAALPDGRFALIASRRGYASSAYDEHGGVNTAIVTGENLDTTGLVVQLAPLASISGTVTEDSGDPVPGAQIHLFREDPMRLNARQRANVANADEMGNFEVSQLRPGIYYLCVTGTPWYRPDRLHFANGADQEHSPLDVAYAPSCYPDTADPDAAEPITVNPGDPIEINVTLHAVPAIRVSFQIPRPEPNQGFRFPQLSQDILGTKEFVQGVPIWTNPNQANPNDTASGDTVTVTLSGLAPGQYEVEFPESVSNPAPARMSAIRASFGAIRVSSSDLTVDMSTLQSAASISGKVLMEGSGKAPGSASISLVGDGPDPVSTDVIQPDGTFHLNNAPPGDYEVRINGSEGSLAVSQLKINGAASKGATLHLGSDPIELTVIASAAIAAVSGSVVRNGKPTSGVFVLLVPSDLHAGIGDWILNQSDSDGSFISERVPPGKYTAVAIDEGWKLDWHRPEVIAPYLAHGVAITIPPGSRSAVLKSPLEAQSSGAPAAQ